MAKEAKKEQELTVEQKLKALYQLQTMLSKIDEIKTLRGELPLEVEDLEDDVAGLTTRIERIKSEIAELKEAVATKRVEIETAKATIVKYKEQQENVRNNREYDNLTKEIEYQELEIEASQRKIGKFKEELETRQADKAKTVSEIEDKTVDLNQKRNELDTILSETKEQTEKLMLRAADIEKHIENRLVMAFHRIRKNAHNGLSVVKVERDSCGGCHSKIPAQRQLDIRLRKKIIVCELCGRILVDAEIDAKKK